MKGKKGLANYCMVVGAVLLLAAMLSCSSRKDEQKEQKDYAVLEADFSKKASPVSKTLFGIFYEDINYAADGGLYGEMIQNRSFEFRKSRRHPAYSWLRVAQDGRRLSGSVETATSVPLNDNNPTYAHITTGAALEGIANRGYFGLSVEAGKSYPGSVYLRSPDNTVKSVSIILRDEADDAVLATQTIAIGTAWRKYGFRLDCPRTTERGRLELHPLTAGTVDADMVSLFRADIYKDEENGLRKDLAELLEAMHPAFMRFPGGCVIEGQNIGERYRWKDTIGPVEERREEVNFWGYQQSYGLGFYEYFRLCEDIGAEPVPVINAGLSFLAKTDAVPLDDMEPYIQDALDLIEYANGSETSTWGKKRAAAGHPSPFNLKYLALGNENVSDCYFERYQKMAAEICKAYPDIKLIISAGPYPGDKLFHSAWRQVKSWKKDKATEALVQLVDEHYYCAPEWFFANTSRYDDRAFYPRTTGSAKVFVGEYAAHADGKKSTLYAALAAGAYMTAIERNGDVVELASYAPLFAKKGSTQWTPDMIWFTNSKSYATPDYYVQQLFMTHRSDFTVPYTLVQPLPSEPQKSIGGSVGLGAWLTAAAYSDVTLTDSDSGTLLYSSAQADGLDGWRRETGNWDFENGSIIQNANATNCRAFLADISAENYTLEMTARKTAGQEGFIIIFGAQKQGKEFYWWNLGGWGNTASCIEKGNKSVRAAISEIKDIHIEENREYRLKLELAGEHIRCYLDGKLLHDIVDKINADPLYAHVGTAADGKIYIKIVNISEKEQPVHIHLKKAPELNEQGSAVIISGNPSDENSFEFPSAVSPVTEELNGLSRNFVYTAKPSSITVLNVTPRIR